MSQEKIDVLGMLAQLAAGRKPSVSLSAWLVEAREFVNEVRIDKDADAGTELAANFTFKVIDLIEASFPADHQLCGSRQLGLDRMLAEVGGAIEFAFGKTAA